jgi:ABC-type polysaccharide/polyol phosphate export permease
MGGGRMTAALEVLDAGLSVVKRDFKLMASYRLRLATTLLSVFFSLTLFYYISRLVKVPQFGTHDEYYAFALVGLIILQVVNSTLQTPSTTLRQELVAGTFERIVLSPFGPVGGVISMLVFPFLFTLLTASCMLVFASAVFGAEVHWGTAPLAIPVACLSALAFAPFGLMFLAGVLVVKQAIAGATWVVAGISLIAGLYFPASLLPDWIEWATNVQPFTPAVDLMRHLLMGTPLGDPAWLDLLKLIGFAAALMPLAAWLVAAAVRWSRRRGTITEY